MIEGLNKSQSQAVVHHGKPLLVIAGPGCVSGDTVIPFNRAGKGFRCSIRRAFLGFHQLRHPWDLTIPTFVRSFTGERIRLHQIRNIVQSGKKQTYWLNLENDFRLRATYDHLIFTRRGYVQLGDLTVDDAVACDSFVTPFSGKKKPRRRDDVVECLNYHPYGSRHKNGKYLRVEKHRLAYEANLNGLLLDEFISILKTDMGKARKLKFLDPKLFDVHHVDFDPTNNDPSNLAALSNPDHRKLHASFQYNNFNHGRLDFVPVSSVVKADIRMTYDIQCESTHHNFVANGMVIHNSGKTKTLTNRVAHLIKHHGILPSRLFVTTFTNKAADEMQDRLLPMIGDRKADSLRIGTSHSLCRKILLDVLDQGSRDVFVTPRLLMGGGRFFKSMMWFASAGLDKKETKAALHQIGCWKNEGVTVEQALELKGFEAYYAKFYEVYQKDIVENDFIDFDDMLFRTYYELIKPKNERFLDRLQNRIEHVLVDEGQDLNKIQFMLTKLLSHKHKQVTLVADDCQLIYSFRGASVDYLHDFIDWFQPEQIKLEQNYRSTKVIVDFGNRLIKNNKNQLEKVLFTENDHGTPPQLLISFNPDDEAQKILEIVDELVSVDGYQLGDIAMIYRTNSQSRALVDILVKNQTPHKVHSKFGFYDRSEIKDIITYLRICNNPYGGEIEDFRRIINRPTRYLGHAFISKAEDHQIDNGQDTFWEGLSDFISSGDIAQNQQRNAAEFVDQINSIFRWQNEKERTTSDLVNHILSVVPYREWLEKKDDEDGDDDEPDNDKKLNVESLLIGAARFPRVEDFLYFIDSMKKQDDKEDDAEVLHLMTAHKSKGCEYPCVFVVGCSDKLLPHYRAEDQEEERRVCYVAVTRAEERLFISAIHGKYSRLNVTVSPFISEMGMVIPKLEHRFLGEGMESRTIGSIKNPFPSNMDKFKSHLDHTVGMSNGNDITEDE